VTDHVRDSRHRHCGSKTPICGLEGAHGGQGYRNHAICVFSHSKRFANDNVDRPLLPSEQARLAEAARRSPRVQLAWDWTLWRAGRVVVVGE
jgi:hypothetical protein